jgi:hypothetical protein
MCVAGQLARIACSRRPKELAYFYAGGTLGRAQNSGHEPSVAVEHDDRLEAVFVLMGLEQAKLLAAMHGVEGIVEVKHDPLGNSGIGRAIQIHQGFSHAQKRAQIGPFSPNLNTTFRELVDPKKESAKFMPAWHYALGGRGAF